MFYWFVKSAPFTSCLYIKNVGTEEGNCTHWGRQRIKGFDNGIFSNHLKHDISVWFYQLPKTNWPICQQLKSALTIYLSTENQQGGMSLSTSGGRMTGSLVKLSCREQRVSVLEHMTFYPCLHVETLCPTAWSGSQERMPPRRGTLWSVLLFL